MEILNYVQVTDNIHTSGQPKEHEFQDIASLGIKTVINLAMPDSDTALSNEGALVTSSGMNYLHIPVIWKDPKEEQFKLFQAIMNEHSHSKIWIHCALNWRVSSFIYLYKLKELGQTRERAYQELLNVWEPNDDWRQFIKKIA